MGPANPSPHSTAPQPPPPRRGDVIGDESAAIRSIVRKKSEPLNSAHSSLCGSSQSASFQKNKKIFESRQPRGGGENVPLTSKRMAAAAVHILVRSRLHALPSPMLSLAKPALICRRGSGRRGGRGGEVGFTKAPSHILPPIFFFLFFFFAFSFIKYRRRWNQPPSALGVNAAHLYGGWF